MEPVWKEAFFVAGPQVRTSNAAEMAGAGRIAGLWARFRTEAIGGAVTYGVYSQYASDHTGDFTLTAGVRSERASDAGVHVSAGHYLAFPAHGPLPAAILEAWQTVWDHFAAPGPYVRAYDTDFEVYDSPTNATIFIGVKQRT